MRWLTAFLLLVCMACESQERSDYHLPKIPEAFPLPDSIRHMSEQAKRQAELGRKLFFDKRLSTSNQFSCASCHLPNLAFSGGIDRNIGENQGRARRNTQALFNLWHYRAFFHDGGIPRLAEVALSPMDNSHELNLPIDTLVRKLWTQEDYTKDFRRVYHDDATPYNVTRALMWYQLSLVSANSRFDRWYFMKEPKLTEQELRGWKLFNSAEMQCGSCHPAPLFTDGEFHHNGYENLHETDTGRARISMLASDEGKFRTPSLRNLAFSAPYMHDGALKTIDDVLQHYNRGGVAHVNKDVRIKPLNLSRQDQADLKAFLLSLSDSNFVKHPAYRPSGFPDR